MAPPPIKWWTLGFSTRIEKLETSIWQRGPDVAPTGSAISHLVLIHYPCFNVKHWKVQNLKANRLVDWLFDTSGFMYRCCTSWFSIWMLISSHFHPFYLFLLSILARNSGISDLLLSDPAREPCRRGWPRTRDVPHEWNLSWRHCGVHQMGGVGSVSKATRKSNHWHTSDLLHLISPVIKWWFLKP